MSVLEIKRSTIEAHWDHLTIELQGLFAATDRNFTVSREWTSDGGGAGLMGSSAEYTNRHRGGRTPILPLFPENLDRLPYWISWLEEWNVVRSDIFRFRSTNLTFFWGPIGEGTKVQLFRAEWPGLADWGNGEIGWQAPGAGHPHWQFEAAQSIADTGIRRERVRRLMAILGNDGEPEEFGDHFIDSLSEYAEPDAPDMRWARMHFACQANWAQSRWNGDINVTEHHAHSPASVQEIRHWLYSVLQYIRHEIRKAE